LAPGSNDPGAAPVRGPGPGSEGDLDDQNAYDARRAAWDRAQQLLQGGPGSLGNIEFNKDDSGWSKYGGDLVTAGTLLGGGAVIGGGIAAGAGVGGEVGATGLTEGLGGGALASESGFVPGSFELGVGSAEGLGTGVASGGSGMGFFDDILNDVPADPEYGIDDIYSPGPGETQPTYGDWPAETPDWIRQLTGPAQQLARRLLGGGGGGGSGSGSGSNFNPWALGAGLAAVNYARNQDPFDTSRLETAYSSIDPNSLAFPYDIETGKGRESLTSSLTNRGVMGSSFGNQDISSYDTMRGLGRQNLLTGGATAQANIGNQILQAQIAQQKNKNDLYGRALLALSGVGAPRNPLDDLFR